MAEAETRLSITLLSDGQVTVTGPINNRLLCYGLLEIAKEVIHAAHKERTAVLPVTGMSSIRPNGS